MDENTQTAQVGTSAAVEVPKNPEDYANWRVSGKLPEQPAAANGNEKPAEGEANTPGSDSEGKKPTGQKGAPVSETGKETKEPIKSRSTAQARLEEVLGILKEEDLTPAKL